MRLLLVLIVPLFAFAETTFISPLEYASQLYKNPRGIGCQNCHGDNGEGKLIAKYIHKKEKKEFRGPKITGLDFKQFYKALNERKRGMPRYFLTKKEVQALYLYLNQEQESNAKK
ncbi:MAG: cytochrome c [Epsilonproteobacteria bacterium]|nr:MAG: cytochrome c [Campylobacterota bacterium]